MSTANVTTYTVKILEVDNVTHNVKRFKVEKPDNYTFVPGQATEVSINLPGWENEKRPFTFTSLNESSYLEFTIKNYSDHNGMTNKLRSLEPGGSLIIADVWGAIEYKGAGYFIAGGAGITPFIAILRWLKKENRISGNKLFFSNRTTKDIIYENELTEILGKDNIINLITDELHADYDDRFINEEFLKNEIDDFGKPFYVCGPEQMVNEINAILLRLGAGPEKIVFEK